MIMENHHIGISRQLHIELNSKAALNGSVKGWDGVLNKAKFFVMKPAMGGRAGRKPGWCIGHGVLADQLTDQSAAGMQINANTGKSLLEAHGACISIADVKSTGHRT
jgi:hypothetical protein